MAEQVLGFRIEVKGTDQQTQQLSKLGNNIDQLTRRIKLLNDIQRNGTPLTARQTREKALLTTQLKATRSQYNSLNKEILINNGVMKKSSGLFSGMKGAIMSSAGAMLGWTALIGGAIAVVKNIVGIFTDFQKANSKLEAVLGASGAEMDMLSTQAKNLGSVTAFTASNVVDLQTEFAKLGFPTKDILNMTESTLDAAAALGSELGEQAALSGAVLKQYSLDSSEAARVNDVLAKSAASSALDFSKLSTALPIVGATAASAGVSLERTTALLGTLADRGVDASTAATSLRNIFLTLSAKGLTFEQAMNKINTAADKNKVSFELFGKRGATAGVILAQTGVSAKELEEKLLGADGAAKKMADTMLNNLSGDVTKANSAWEGFVLSLEDGDGVISSVMRSVVQGFTEFLGAITLVDSAVDNSIESLEKEQDVLIDLQVELNTTSVNSQRRVKIIKELQELYPDLLSNIDAETVSNIDLQKALNIVNESVRTRLLLQEASKEADDIDIRNKKEKKFLDDETNRILKEGTLLLINKGKADLLNGKTIEEQLEIIKEQSNFFSFLGGDVQRLQAHMRDLNSFEKIGNDVREESIKVIQELLKNSGDLNELTTQELKNLVKTGVLTDEKLNRQAREIIITRELKNAKKELSDEAIKGLVDEIEAEEKAAKKREKQPEEDEADKLAARLKAIDDGDKLLLKKREELFLSERMLQKEHLTKEFEDRINAITGDSEREKLLRQELKTQERLEVKELEAQWEIEDEEEAAKEKEKKDKEQEKTDKEELDNLRKKQKEKQQIVQESLNLLSAISQLAGQRELNSFDARAKKELDSFRGTAEGKKALEEKLTQEREGIAKKIFEREKKINTLKAIMNTAVAVTSVSPVIPLMALIAALGAVEVATIQSQQFAEGGLVEGPSHQQGGIQMYHKSGKHIGEMEGNEYIISAKRVQEIGKDNLDAMNFSGQIPQFSDFFANGGQVPNIQGISASTNTNQLNFSMEQLGDLISEKMQEMVLRTKVVNNAVDTFSTAQRVKNTENSLKFG